MSISGVTEESWTEDNMKVLDQFIVNTMIPSVVVYVHTSNGLQVDYNTPLLVLFYFYYKIICSLVQVACIYQILSLRCILLTPF